MALWGYFDEAGHPQDPNAHAFVLAGCLATEEQWAVLEHGWLAILCEEGVKDSKGIMWFHWRSWRHGKDPFVGWTRERRDNLRARLTAEIQNNVTAVIAAFKYLEPNEPRQTTRYVYQQAHTYAALSSRSFRHHEREQVHFAFARYDVSPGERHRALQEIPSYRDSIGDVVAADPRDKPGLQAADLIASEIYAWLPNGSGTLPASLQALTIPFVLRGVQDISLPDVAFWSEIRRMLPPE